MPRVINVAGWRTCGFYKKAKTVVESLGLLFPTKYQANIKEFEDKPSYQEWLDSVRGTINAGDQRSSPYCWFDENERIGGCDDFLAWARAITNPPKSDGNPNRSVFNGDKLPNIDTFNKDHTYDYDCIVIGGGSGGLACAKEIAQYGAKVACLDFVKPSPQGSTWGLGGTCVNVGCIPKKLMHTASLLGEHHEQAASYGWKTTPNMTHDWDTLRTNVQDHIKGTNFGYRVQLREKGVTYLNKLGKFVGPNTLQVTDKKGKTEEITSARFVVAVGGRPSQLSCPGAEYAVTSDDLFSLENAPGKTCVIGAGYVALECAGFITGLHQGEVQVCVRSIPLRGFDRDVVDRVVTEMKRTGTKFNMGILPASIEKVNGGKLKVTFTDGSDDIFDTVLCATGRYADTDKLGLSDLVKLNKKNGKMICTNEQSSMEHIYAIGDVVDAAPELTPVAIQAGKFLAARLFGNKTQFMDYKDIATTVFTPLEFGTVGLNEDEAREKYGDSNVDCYLSAFSPLEWTIVEELAESAAYCKVIIDKMDNERILGLHIAAPNAGEIIQGFAVAFRKGLYFKDLSDTVGIHPTIAEEFTTINILKSSGESVQKTSC